MPTDFEELKQRLLQTDEEFQRRVIRADQIVESQGVVTAAIGEGLASGMAQFQGEIDDLD